MELESYSTAGIIHVRMRVWVEFLRACVSAIYPLLDIRSRARNWKSSWMIQLSSFFRIAFSFNFFTLVDFFKAFFQNSRLQFK